MLKESDIIAGYISAQKAEFGNNVNKTQIESDGTIKFIGNATIWNDLPNTTPLVTAKPGSGNNPSLTVLVGGITQYTFDVNDYVVGASEFMHEYKEGSNFDIHVHWVTNGSEGSDKYVKWELEYSICNADATAPYGYAFSGSTSPSLEILIPASTPDRSHIISVIDANVSGTGLLIGSYIIWKFRRIAAAGTAPAANPFALAIGFHYEQDTVGSRTRIEK